MKAQRVERVSKYKFLIMAVMIIVGVAIAVFKYGFRADGFNTYVIEGDKVAKLEKVTNEKGITGKVFKGVPANENTKVVNGLLEISNFDISAGEDKTELAGTVKFEDIEREFKAKGTIYNCKTREGDFVFDFEMENETSLDNIFAAVRHDTPGIKPIVVEELRGDDGIFLYFYDEKKDVFLTFESHLGELYEQLVNIDKQNMDMKFVDWGPEVLEPKPVSAIDSNINKYDYADNLTKIEKEYAVDYFLFDYHISTYYITVQLKMSRGGEHRIHQTLQVTNVKRDHRWHGTEEGSFSSAPTIGNNSPFWSSDKDAPVVEVRSEVVDHEKTTPDHIRGIEYDGNWRGSRLSSGINVGVGSAPLLSDVPMEVLFDPEEEFMEYDAQAVDEVTRGGFQLILPKEEKANLMIKTSFDGTFLREPGNKYDFGVFVSHYPDGETDPEEPKLKKVRTKWTLPIYTDGRRGYRKVKEDTIEACFRYIRE